MCRGGILALPSPTLRCLASLGARLLLTKCQRCSTNNATTLCNCSDILYLYSARMFLEKSEIRMTLFACAYNVGQCSVDYMTLCRCGISCRTLKLIIATYDGRIGTHL